MNTLHSIFNCTIEDNNESTYTVPTPTEEDGYLPIEVGQIFEEKPDIDAEWKYVISSHNNKLIITNISTDGTRVNAKWYELNGELCNGAKEFEWNVKHLRETYFLSGGLSL